jgi:NAD(P)-dependent dehydrogenase (short-subunit alcohol dehydrogenase family)
MSLLQVHCLGALIVVQALKGNLLAGPHPVVLNMSSRLGSLGLQYDGTFSHLQASYAYRIAKAAQNMLTLCLRAELGDRIDFISRTPGRLMTAMAQTDASLTAEEGAERIISFWESGHFKSQNGIFQVPDNLAVW